MTAAGGADQPPGLEEAGNGGGAPLGAGLRYPPVLTAEQVAALLQLNIDYVRELTREGIIPAHRLPGGRTFRYLQDEILAWLRDQPIRHTDQPG